jgi:hypothetical protein
MKPSGDIESPVATFPMFWFTFRDHRLLGAYNDSLNNHYRLVILR